MILYQLCELLEKRSELINLIEQEDGDNRVNRQQIYTIEQQLDSTLH